MFASLFGMVAQSEDFYHPRPAIKPKPSQGPEHNNTEWKARVAELMNTATEIVPIILFERLRFDAELVSCQIEIISIYKNKCIAVCLLLYKLQFELDWSRSLAAF